MVTLTRGMRRRVGILTGWDGMGWDGGVDSEFGGWGWKALWGRCWGFGMRGWCQNMKVG